MQALAVLEAIRGQIRAGQAARRACRRAPGLRFGATIHGWPSIECSESIAELARGAWYTRRR